MVVTSSRPSIRMVSTAAPQRSVVTSVGHPANKMANDPCEYNPDEKRAAWENEVHAQADFVVGANGQWRLCASCAALPEFKRYRKRVKIKKV